MKTSFNERPALTDKLKSQHSTAHFASMILTPGHVGHQPEPPAAAC